MKTTKANEIKNQIKVNFESMTFEAAMSANAELFKEYEEIKGKRSLTSLISYYRSKANATVEPEENLEPVNEPEATEIPVKESESEEAVTLSIGNISRDWVKSFLEGNQPSKESFCIVREYYFCKAFSRNAIIRYFTNLVSKCERLLCSQNKRLALCKP